MPTIAVLGSRLVVTDLAYLLRAGRIMLDTHAVLRVDVFTYTIYGQPWLNQQWGASVLLSAWYALFAWRGLIVLQAAIVGACFGATYRCCASRGASKPVSAVATLICFAVVATLPGALALRPQLLALPLFVTSAWILRERATHPRRLFLLPLIGIAWANLHGSFIMLPALVGIALVADLYGRRATARWTGPLLVVTLLTPLVSPWGPAIYGYIWDLSRSPIARQIITEWQPLLTRVPAGVLFLCAMALFGVVAVRYGRRRPTLEEALTVLFFTSLALWSGRSVLWWAMAIPPVFAGVVAGWRPGEAWSRGITRLVAVGLVLTVAIGLGRVATQPADALRAEAPPGITAWLQTHTERPGRVLAEHWGGWFEFAVPEQPMFVDSRVVVFPDRVWSEFLTVVNAQPGWSDVLDRWRIDTVIVASGHHPELIEALSSNGWTLSYQDGDGSIYTRRLAA